MALLNPNPAWRKRAISHLDKFTETSRLTKPRNDIELHGELLSLAFSVPFRVILWPSFRPYLSRLFRFRVNHAQNSIFTRLRLTCSFGATPTVKRDFYLFSVNMRRTVGTTIAIACGSFPASLPPAWAMVGRPPPPPPICLATALTI